MSQFPQGNGFAPQQMPQQGFQGAQGTFPPQQAPQGQGYVPQQQNFQQQPAGPQLQKVNLGQGYAPGQFPHLNSCHMIGQVFPNQWMPQGLEYKANDKGGGTLNINVKIRNAWGDQPNQVKIQFIRVVVFGGLAQHLMNQLRAGMFVEFQGEFRPNKYKSNKTQKITSVNQVILSARQNEAAPLRVIGEGPMYEEIDPNRQQGWTNGGGQPQQGWGAPAQPAQQQWGAPAQQPQQFQQQPAQQPAQGAWAPQAMPQQQMPQGQPVAQGGFVGAPQQQMAPAPQQFQQQPQFAGGFNGGQATHPTAGVPQQPSPGQMNGTFAPPQQQMMPQGQPIGQQPMPQQGFPQPGPQAGPAGFQPPAGAPSFL